MSYYDFEDPERFAPLDNGDVGDYDAPATYDYIGAIIDYESGSLDYDGTIRLFQHLVDGGIVWRLQGSYGRTAAALIESGEVFA